MRCAAFLAAVVFALPALAFDYGEIPLNKAVRSNGYVGRDSRDGEIHYFYEKDHIAHLAEKGVESAAKRRMDHEVERSPQDELLSDTTPVYNDGTGLKAFGGAANDS
ncbi:hypothetical protein JCM24511_00131 [Saitozyma sp. JCM 24511]|nr:hypothetical protein JCM24511_00131 [Saitozyma sp. JCM 24511]